MAAARSILFYVASSATVALLATAVTASGAMSAPQRPPGALADATPVILPAHPTGLKPPGPMGHQVDAPAGYQEQLACVAKPSRGVAALRALALSTYQRGGESPATPRACTSGGTSEHKDGRAWDWMLAYSSSADRKAAADFLSWLTGDGPQGQPGEMADRLGVMYVIYNKMMWSSYDRRWHAYSGSDPHTSHIHISLSWNGARAHTSFWTGHLWATDYGPCQAFVGQPALSPGRHPQTSPCSAPQQLVRTSPESLAWMGSSGASVVKAQRLLGVAATGVFGRPTRHAALTYQRRHDLPETGAVDQSTWASLVPSRSTLHEPDWTPAEAAAWARRAGSPVVRSHDAGTTVFALQTALGMPGRARSGFYGPGTRSLVLAVKSAHELGPGAKVDAEVWALLPQG